MQYSQSAHLPIDGARLTPLNADVTSGISGALWLMLPQWRVLLIACVNLAPRQRHVGLQPCNRSVIKIAVVGAQIELVRRSASKITSSRAPRLLCVTRLGAIEISESARPLAARQLLSLVARHSSASGLQPGISLKEALPAFIAQQHHSCGASLDRCPQNHAQVSAGRQAL